MDGALDGLYAGDASAYEDCGHDCKAGASLGDLRVKRERDSQWHGGQGIAEIVDQVGQQSNAATRDKHDGLGDGREPRTASDSETARTPSRERLMLSCTSPWEWPCSSWWASSWV